MKTVEIIGYRRANLGKTGSQKLRDEGLVPCVLYGGDEQIHFYSPMILFREVVYTNEAHFVHLNIEGEESRLAAPHRGVPEAHTNPRRSRAASGHSAGAE